MRSTIQQLLVEGVPAVSGRVMTPYSATSTTTKPFLVLKDASPEPAAPWAELSTPIEVWAHVSKDSYSSLEDLASAVRSTLANTSFSVEDEHYLVEQLHGTAPEAYDESLDTVARCLSFRVFTLGWQSGLSYTPDPVAALRSWASARWPGEVQTDPGSWSPANSTPAIYFRLASVASVQPTNWGAWIEGRFRVHVVAPLPATRLLWTRRLTEALALARGVPLSDSSFLDVTGVAAKTHAHPVRHGQIKLAARWGVLKTSPSYAVLGRAYLDGAEVRNW